MIPLLLTSLSFGAGADIPPPAPAQPPLYQIAIVLKTGDPIGSRDEGNQKNLSEPTVVTQENIAATITTGKVEEDKRKPGQNLTVSVSRIDENKAMLKIVYHETKIAGQSPLTIREIDLSDRVEVKFGKTIHQRLAVTSLTDQTWAEITVRKANP